MKIIIATSAVPFVEGGSTYIVKWLAQKMREAGHEVELFEFPFQENYVEMLDQMLALRLLDLTEHGDRLITVRSPSHLLKHPAKVVWFTSHYREAYDLWGTQYQGIPDSPGGLAYRAAIMAADDCGLAEASRLFCNSCVVRDRLRSFNHVDAEVLYPPLLAPDQFYNEGCGDYLLYCSRLTHQKRQWLAIESLRHTASAVKLVIAGCPDPGADWYLEQLYRLVEKYRLEDRVSIIPRWISEQEKIALFARCLAGMYFPIDEDSYGYPSLEAHAARKSVLTTTDAGGTNELIVSGTNGFVTPPDPELIAGAMDQLYNNRTMAQQMGEAGWRRVTELGIGWDRVLAKLLS